MFEVQDTDSPTSYQALGKTAYCGEVDNLRAKVQYISIVDQTLNFPWTGVTFLYLNPVKSYGPNNQIRRVHRLERDGLNFDPSLTRTREK